MSKTRKKIAFGWYGGKFSHLNWLLPPLPENLQYCEPFNHIRLAEVLNSVRGKVALSGYRCELYEELYKDWHMHVGPPQKSPIY